MNKYAIYAGDVWLTDLHADDEHDALSKAKKDWPTATRVELVALVR